jgi:hypothetical protein
LTATYKQAGFKVVEGTSAGLHSMLAAGRFQHFPRAIDEAIYEQAAYMPNFPTLSVERSFALYVPSPRYFFVGGGQKRPAQRLEYGLQQLIADGRFDHLFHESYDGLIEKAGLRKRRVFHIDNPQLSPQTRCPTRRTGITPIELRQSEASKGLLTWRDALGEMPCLDIHDWYCRRFRCM